MGNRRIKLEREEVFEFDLRLKKPKTWLLFLKILPRIIFELLMGSAINVEASWKERKKGKNK